MDPKELSSNRIIDIVRVGDSTVEVIGYVDSIIPPDEKEGRQYKVYKFCLNNAKGKRIQVVICDDKIINKLQDKIELNHIIHLDKALALPLKPRFNIGNVLKYELLINQSTEVSIFGKYMNLELITELHKLKDITQDCIVEAYIKSTFSEASSFDNKNKRIGFGSITDGTYKVEVNIRNYINNDLGLLKIRKGDKIKITGLPQTQKNNDIIYLLVNNIEDIKLIDGHMEASMLQEGVVYVTKSQEKRKLGETSQESHKTLKYTFID